MNTRFSLLATALLLVNAASHGMEALTDDALSAVNGADGIQMSVRADQIISSTLYASDNAGDGTGGAANGITQYHRVDALRINPVTSGGTVGADITYQTGTISTGAPTSRLSVTTTPMAITGSGLKVCDSTTGGTCTTLTGSTSLSMPTGAQLSIASRNGILGSRSDQAVGTFIGIDNVDFAVQQTATDNTTINQFVLGDIRVNINSTGRLYVTAAEGFRFRGNASLNSIVDGNGYRPGVQLALKHVSGSNSATPQTGYITRVGASGSIRNLDVTMRGTNDTDGVILGRTVNNGPSIAGSSGLALNIRGFLGPDFSYEIGESGSAGRSFRFSQLVPFDNPTAALGTAAFNLGDMYLNTFNSARLGLPVSPELNSAIAFNIRETPLTDGQGISYQTLGTSPVTGTALAVRGLSLQGLPRVTEIINNRTGTPTRTITGSLLTLINGGNANLALTGLEGRRIGFALAASTDGLSSNNRATTMVGLADTASNLYFGLRNIDSLIQGRGSLDISSTGINLAMPELLLAASGELAAGFLMTSATNFSSNSNVTGNSRGDVLAGVRLKLDARDVNVSIIPSQGEDGLAFTASLTLPRVNGDRLGTAPNTGTDTSTRFRSAGTFVHLIEPSDGSILGLENISGNLSVLGARGTDPARIDVIDNGLVMESTVLINGQRNASNARTWGNTAGDLRIGNVNLYPNGNVNAPQRLGEIAMPGGQLYSKVTLRLN